MAQQSLPRNGKPNYDGAISRREFLNYFLGASVLTVAAGSCGVVSWYLTPQRRLNDPAGGLFTLAAQDMPRLGADPVWQAEARAWLTRSEGGLLALHGECVFDRIWYRWNRHDDRFECPKCGSKFQIDGTYIEGPAERGLDRFLILATTNAATILQSDAGRPLTMSGIQQVMIDTHMRFMGQPRKSQTQNG